MQDPSAAERHPAGYYFANANRKLTSLLALVRELGITDPVGIWAVVYSSLVESYETGDVSAEETLVNFASLAGSAVAAAFDALSEQHEPKEV